jgi:hypothetical protein
MDNDARYLHIEPPFEALVGQGRYISIPVSLLKAGSIGFFRGKLEA